MRVADTIAFAHIGSPDHYQHVVSQEVQLMRIGFATQDPRSHYWMIIGHAAQERATELGIDIPTLPANTLVEQIAAIDALVDQRVDALLVGSITAMGLANAIKRAQAARIPVIAVSSYLLDCTVACTVRSDNVNGAELAAAHVVERIGGAGEVAHLIGPTHLQDSVERATGVHNLLGRHPDIQIVFEQESPDWNHETGAALMCEALDRYPNLRAVCVANDTLALGAIDAIASVGRTGQIVVTGFDATPDALMAIHTGHMSATVHQSLRGMGRTAVEMARRAAGGEVVPPLVFTDIALVTGANLIDAALETLYILPGVLRDTVERGDALARARDEIIHAQQAALRELSVPLIPISDTMMVMPLIGSIDSQRAQQIIETLLEGIASNATRLVILDITGVPVVDTQVANTLIRTAQAVGLLGAEVVLTGIRPEVAQTLVGLGVDLSGIVTRSSLQNGIAYGLGQR
jgi:ABC-type sugar transport system substrate-binding protein/anti-anti-sigma regulatory factor